MPDTLEKPPISTGYDEDFFLWTRTQATALREAGRAGVNAPVDWENVAEEIEDLGRSQKQKVRSFVFQILAHLIKLKASSRVEPRNGWSREVQVWRRDLKRMFKDNPSLAAQLRSFVEDEWPDALEQATDDLEAFGEDASLLGSLTLLDLMGPGRDRILDRAFIPEPARPPPRTTT